MNFAAILILLPAAWLLPDVLTPRARAAGAGESGAAGDHTADMGLHASTGQSFVPGKSYISPTGYIEYVAGDAPVIVSVPHDGSLMPHRIPDRQSGATARDVWTEDVTRRFAEEFFLLTGRRPHIIINHLHRRKLDANRPIEEAAGGNPEAEAAWHEFHAYIDAAKAAAVQNYGSAFYIDMHGHGHDVQRVEIGYNLSADELRIPDVSLDASHHLIAQSSIRTLYEQDKDRVSFSQLLRGPTSFGALLERRGIPSVPSDVQPAPEIGWEYFKGGYNTRRHGSMDGGPVSGLQIEANRDVRQTEAARSAFARALAEAVAEYLAHHFGFVQFVPVYVREAAAAGMEGMYRGGPLTAAVELVVEAPGLNADRVEVTVDETILYAGHDLSKSFLLDPLAYTPGQHTLSVAVASDDGTVYNYTVPFTVRHFTVAGPWSAAEPAGVTRRLRGQVELVIEPAVTGSELGPVTIELKPAGRAGEAAGSGPVPAPGTLLQAEALPARVTVDTRAYADGSYDLVVRVGMPNGPLSELTEWIVIDNWTVLEDQLLPPENIGWFGTVDRLKTAGRSPGWSHVTGSPERFFDDADRLKPEPGAQRWLVWRLDHLVRFEVTLYTQPDLLDERVFGDVVTIEVSPDGEGWEPVSYSTTVTQAPYELSSPWLKVVIHGSVEGMTPVHFVRLGVDGVKMAPDVLQVGHVRLMGSTGASGGPQEE